VCSSVDRKKRRTEGEKNVNKPGKRSQQIFLIFLTSLTVPLCPETTKANKLTVRWEINSIDEDGFKIERKTDSTAYTEIATVGAGIQSYSDSNLAPNTRYCYRVKAYNVQEDSEYSDENCAFTPASSFTLTVNKSSSSAGTVESINSDINCGSDCSQTYSGSTVFVSLTATPASGHTFSGWSGGGCSGTGNCTLLINTNTTVTATFQ
jgi:hypothetical protein